MTSFNQAVNKLEKGLVARANKLTRIARWYQIQIWILVVVGILAIIFANYLQIFDRTSQRGFATKQLIQQHESEISKTNDDIDEAMNDREIQRNNIKESLNNAGEEWRAIYRDIVSDAVLTFSGLEGIAVGRDGLVLTTSDGGISWVEREQD